MLSVRAGTRVMNLVPLKQFDLLLLFNTKSLKTKKETNKNPNTHNCEEKLENVNSEA